MPHESRKTLRTRVSYPFGLAIVAAQSLFVAQRVGASAPGSKVQEDPAKPSRTAPVHSHKGSMSLNDQIVAIGPFVNIQANNALEDNQPTSASDQARPLSLESDESHTATHDANYFAERAYGIGGPWRLRSADALSPGTMSFRNELNWGTGYRSGDDEANYAISIDYGIAPMHHITLETTSVDLGDGAATGNGDIRFGWHWQLLREDDWKPSFALRNYIRVPTGYQSSGVDYELRGLFSKSIADHVRIHFAPFLKSVNSNSIEDVRYFQWGAALGSDWKITEKLDLVVDYVHETSQTEGLRNQHSLDAGFIFEIAKGHKIGINGRVGLDGDGENGDWGAGIFYTIGLDGLPSIGG